MGSGSTKVNNNRTPPSPNNSNFPVQSNPKFQRNSNQNPNQWPNQNSTQYDQRFGNNNHMPNTPHFASNLQDRNSNFAHNNVYRFNENYNSCSNEIPLSPMEIEEYRSQGFHFPPHLPIRNSRGN